MSSFYSVNELKTIGFKKIGKNVSISKNALFYSPENITLKKSYKDWWFCNNFCTQR